MSNVTTQQIKNVLLDTGVLYVNYGQAGQRMIAPITGGISFEVKQDVRTIDRDGSLGKEKGLRRVIREDATLSAKIMDMSITNIKMALAAATVNGANSKITSTQTGLIADTEYFTNVTVIGTDMEGKNKIITLFNALADGGLKLDMKDNSEAALDVSFAGHRDPTDSTQPLYTIEEVNSIAPDLTGLVVTTATLAPLFSGSVYTYGTNVSNVTASVTVTPTCATADSITVNGTTVASGSASGAITLSTGINTITVIVKKAGYTNKTYTITVVKAA